MYCHSPTQSQLELISIEMSLIQGGGGRYPLSINVLVKGNAALLLNRIPSFPAPPIDGDL